MASESSCSESNCSASVTCQCNSTSVRCTAVGNGSLSSSEAFCECNFTDYLQGNVSEQLTKFIHGNYNRVVYILTLAISCLLLMVILIILSPYRRNSRNSFLIGALWASQVLPFTIIAYTLGLMQSPPYQNTTYAIWAMLCLLIHGISSSRLYGLQDKQQEKQQACKEATLLYWASWSMYLHHDGGRLQGPLLSILGAAFLKFIFGLIQPCFAYFPSCRHFGLRRRVELVADFMSFEHELSEECPSSMIGYKYLVKEEENILKLIADKDYCLKNPKTINETAVTVERIWKCKRTFLSSTEGGKLKDKCLSFAMFRLLLMRFSKFSSHEKHRSKNWALVRDGLLSEQTKPERAFQTKHERAFQVVEDELSFLYDYFFTQYPVVFSDGMFFIARTAIYAFLEFAQFVACLWIIIGLATSCLEAYTSDYEFCSEDRIWSHFLDYDCNHVLASIHYFGICIFVAVYVVLQTLQLLSIVFSDWAEVWLLCKYVERPGGQWNKTLERLLRFVCGWEWIRQKPWRRKIGQYYLLSSYKYLPILYFPFSAFFSIPKRGQKSYDSKKLHPWVKSAVLDSLMENVPQLTNGNVPQLTNGSSSLRRNNIYPQLSWACNFKSITDSILVWHVATSLCIMKWKNGKESKGIESDEIKRKREVAECLSGYCAYLVAFVPALLPNPTDATEVIFDKAILEARDILGSCRDSDVYERLKGEVAQMELQPLGNKQDEEQVVGVYSELKDSGGKGDGGVVRKGAKLGIQLLSDVRDEAQIWKVLADFWAEMTLFLAPSENLTAHAESVKDGGEFITLLWALLTHAGVTRRESIRCREDDKNIDSVTGAEHGTQPSAPRQSRDAETTGVSTTEHDNTDSFNDGATTPAMSWDS